jgi:hypothetical protein
VLRVDAVVGPLRLELCELLLDLATRMLCDAIVGSTKRRTCGLKPVGALSSTLLSCDTTPTGPVASRFLARFPAVLTRLVKESDDSPSNVMRWAGKGSVKCGGGQTVSKAD